MPRYFATGPDGQDNGLKRYLTIYYRMMNLQIRLRTPSLDDVWNYLKNPIHKAEKYLIFHHNKPDNNHYHIYLFNVEYDPDSVRKQLRRSGYDKTKYSVSEKAGKDRVEITPSGAYTYGCYDKQLKTISDPVSQKGFNDAELVLMKEKATLYHAEPAKYTPQNGDVIVVHQDNYISRPDKTWEKLVDQIDKFKDKSVKQIKSMIAAQWINEGKAVPRPSDCHRYAISIYYRLKYDNKDWDFTVPDWALEGEYA